MYIRGLFLFNYYASSTRKGKKNKRNLTKENLDKENRLELLLQKRYGEQGAIIMRLVSKLKYNRYHIISNNTFLSMQLALD